MTDIIIIFVGCDCNDVADDLNLLKCRERKLITSTLKSVIVGRISKFQTKHGLETTEIEFVVIHPFNIMKIY